MQKMKPPIALVLGLLIFTSCAQENKVDLELEESLLLCITQAYEQQGIDIKTELDLFESYLISNHYLESGSGESYHQFFKRVEELNENTSVVRPEEFVNIYKVHPSTYSDCIEEVRSQTKYQNTLVTRLDAAIKRQIEEKGISLTTVSSAITKTLKPFDFQRDYFRYYYLLTIAYTSDTDTGLAIKRDMVDYSKFVVLELNITSDDHIELEGVRVDIATMSEKVKQFIVEHDSLHMIRMEAAADASYDLYSRVQDRITGAYDEVWDTGSMALFGSSYSKLTEEQRDEIRRLYPSRLIEN
jgi:hypothetical protein